MPLAVLCLSLLVTVSFLLVSQLGVADFDLSQVTNCNCCRNFYARDVAGEC